MADVHATVPGCATVPSATAAADFLRRQPGSLGHLAVTMAGRTAIVALGLYAAGFRKGVWPTAFGGVLALELAILAMLYVRDAPAGDPADYCPTLPTVDSAGDLLDGKPGALLRVAGDTLVRAGEMGIGMWLAGGSEQIVAKALAGSVTIEAFVVAWTAVDRRTRAQAAQILRSIPTPA